MQPTIRYTAHALSRRAQRNLSDADVQFVIEHGRRTHAAGALHIFLAGRDIPSEKTIARRFGHLEGTVLVLSPDSDPTLITAYRNRRGFKAVRTKAKYDRRG
jgi:hypothetical protein